MATPKNWDSSSTKKDAGFMHEGSMDNLMLDAYDLVNMDMTLEDQTKYIHAIFHGIEYSETLNKDLFRGYTRSEYSLGITNFITTSEDKNAQSGEEAYQSFKDFIISIIAHDWCSDVVMVVLAYHLVCSGLHVIIPDTFGSDVDQDMYEAIKYFQSEMIGADNSDNFSSRINKRLPKWIIREYLGCSDNKVNNHESRLFDICRELFIKSE